MSKPAGRNNSKIITRNQGGGNKLQGLAPHCTAFYIAKSTGQSYYTETGDGRNRNLVICVNQLGGIGKGRSQFRPNADGNRGAGCDDFETFKTYLREINYYIQHSALPTAFTANGITVGPSNEIINYKLCLVGNSESLISDICANGDPSEYITISNEGFGVGGNRLFTHLLSVPHQQNPSIHALITDPLRISYWNGNNWSTSDKYINVQAIQKQITWCNNYIKTYSGTSYLFTNHNTLTTFGYHTLGLINNNVRFDNKDATRFLQDLSGGSGYGVNQVFNPPTTISPISDNNIKIFTSTYNDKIVISFNFMSMSSDGGFGTPLILFTDKLTTKNSNFNLINFAYHFFNINLTDDMMHIIDMAETKSYCFFNSQYISLTTEMSRLGYKKVFALYNNNSPVPASQSQYQKLKNYLKEHGTTINDDRSNEIGIEIGTSYYYFSPPRAYKTTISDTLSYNYDFTTQIIGKDEVC